jgi:hypothetical protein
MWLKETHVDAPPSSKLLNGFNCESKDEDNRRRKSWGAFLNSQHFGVEGHAKAPRWGLRRLTSKSITHTDLHKPNNKLVNVQLEHLWCMHEARANMDSQDSPWPRLGGSYHLPPYSIFCAWSQGQHPNVILSQDPQVGVPKFPKLGLP